MIKPLRPEDMNEAKKLVIPDFVLQAVNMCMAKNLVRGHGSITQDEVISYILEHNSGITRQQIFDNNWLDFEPLYEEAGWKITYDKPGYDETYEAHWVFKAKQRPPNGPIRTLIRG